LATLTEILEGKARDRLSIPEKTTLNLDPDWKRKFGADGTSEPFHDLAEFELYRGRADNLRKSGTRALPVAVDMAVKGHKLQGGPRASLERLVYRAIVTAAGGWRPLGATDHAIETQLSLKQGTLANLRRRGSPGTRVSPSTLISEV